jgi:hypothetical protein
MQVVRIVELGGGAQWEGRLSVGVARWAWCVIPVVRGSQCAALTGQNQRSLWPPAESGPKRPSEETAQVRVDWMRICPTARRALTGWLSDG